MVSHMLITLLSTTILFSLAWSAGSHFLNIDAPGKAKIYAIHWLIFSGIFVGSVVGIIWYFTGTTMYSTADLIGAGGHLWIYSMSLIIYVVPYYLGVLLGTARFARSSVLLANKLPGGF